MGDVYDVCHEAGYEGPMKFGGETPAKSVSKLDRILSLIAELDLDDRRAVRAEVTKPISRLYVNGIEVPIGEQLEKVITEMYYPTLDREKYGL